MKLKLGNRVYFLLLSLVMGLILVWLIVVPGSQSATNTNGGPIGPVYPPPGGVNTDDDGDAGMASGVVITVTGMELDRFIALYFATWDEDSVRLSFDGETDEPGEFMDFDLAQSDLANGIGRWTGEADLVYDDGGGLVTVKVDTRTTLSTTDLEGGIIPQFDGQLAGIPEPGSVMTITGDFVANFLIEAYFGGNWYPARELFNALHTPPGTQVKTDIWYGFYYRPWYLVYLPSVVKTD